VGRRSGRFVHGGQDEGEVRLTTEEKYSWFSIN